MASDRILELSIAERDKLSKAISALQDTPKRPPTFETSPMPAGPSKRSKRTISAATRKKMAEGQRRRFAKMKA
jgi:hypothetical protein